MQWENITDYYYAWAIYLAGATGCSIAAWLFFRGLPRALVHFLVITVMVLLFTPYAIDPDTMIMAPALVSLGYGAITDGFTSVKPVLKPLIGIWAVAMILSLIYQLLTRNRYKAKQQAIKDEQDHNPEKPHQQLSIERKEEQKVEPTIGGVNQNTGFAEPIRAER